MEHRKQEITSTISFESDNFVMNDRKDAEDFETEIRITFKELDPWR